LDIVQGRTEQFKLHELTELHSLGSVECLSESRELGDLVFYDLTVKEQSETLRRLNYINKLKDREVRFITVNTENIIKEIALEMNEKPPHWQTIRNWMKCFEKSGGRIKSLYPKHRLKGSRGDKLDPHVVDIINKEIKRFFNLSQPSLATIARNVEIEVSRYNIQNPDNPITTPSYVTIHSRANRELFKNKTNNRLGKRKLESMLSKEVGEIKTNRVLSRVEIDHTLLDIHVLSDDRMILLGRPWITVLIDHYSHMVIGFQMSFENPSFTSLSIACLNAFLRKEEFLQDMRCEGFWPAHGIPEEIVCDNGKEFWSDNFSNSINELGSRIQYAPVRKGNYKSRVERFFGIINSLVLDDLPGVVRKINQCGEGYDPRQEAKFTFSEFKRYFLNWLITDYHNKPLRDSGFTPNELWVSSELELIVADENIQELLPILMATASRELRKGGLQLFTLNYNSAFIKEMIMRDGPRTVIIKYNPYDLGYILVLDEVNRAYVKVNCDDLAYASALSVFEHKKIQVEIKNRFTDKITSENYQMARIKLKDERDKVYLRNIRRKQQVSTSKTAKIDKIGVKQLTLISDNTKNNISLNYNEITDDLDMSGWSVEND
jgi:putative transposase